MPLAPEHIPTIDKVNTYLTKRAQGDLCRDVVDCNTWPAEAFLMDDLRVYIERSQPQPAASRVEIRLYLRALSWFQYPPLSDQELLYAIDTAPLLTAADRILFHQALTTDQQDEALEPAAQCIDERFLEAWSNLQKARRDADLPWRAIGSEHLPGPVLEARADIQSLRPIRDALYFRRHLSHWLAWSTEKHPI